MSPRTLLALTALTAPAAPATTHAADDFDPTSEAWNGLSELVALAGEHGLRLEVVREPSWPAGPDAAVLLVHPRGTWDGAAARRFVEEGGRLVVADDFGAGDELLRPFGITRVELASGETERLGGHPALPVARPTGDHPLTRGLDRVVGNHPSGLAGEGDPLATFPATGAHLALERRLGAGRLVALSDGSVLINHMLALPGNRRMAANLLRWAAGGEGRRLLLAPAVTATPDTAAAAGGRRWRLRLDQLDGDVLWLLAIAAFGCALLVLLSLVPGQRETAWLGAEPPAPALRPTRLEQLLRASAGLPDDGDGRLLAALVGQRALAVFGLVPGSPATAYDAQAHHHRRLPGGLAALASVLQQVAETPPAADPTTPAARHWTVREALDLHTRVRALEDALRAGGSHG